MEYRRLGGAGLRVSEVGLGGNNFGRYCDEAQTARVIDELLAAAKSERGCGVILS